MRPCRGFSWTVVEKQTDFCITPAMLAGNQDHVPSKVQLSQNLVTCHRTLGLSDPAAVVTELHNFLTNVTNQSPIPTQADNRPTVADNGEKCINNKLGAAAKRPRSAPHRGPVHSYGRLLDRTHGISFTPGEIIFPAWWGRCRALGNKNLEGIGKGAGPGSPFLGGTPGDGAGGNAPGFLPWLHKPKKKSTVGNSQGTS